MMTDEQKAKVAELKAAIAAGTASAEGAPASVRAAAVSLKLELRREGTTARVLAAALGVHESTLCRWERETSARRPALRGRKRPRRPEPFRMVRVTTPAATEKGTPTSTAIAVPSTGHGLRVVHAPSGLMVDGLDVEALAALLRRMA
jgi:hypothetical protein